MRTTATWLTRVTLLTPSSCLFREGPVPGTETWQLCGYRSTASGERVRPPPFGAAPSRPDGIRRSLVDELDQPAQVRRIGVRQDPVTEVEDMAAAAARATKHVERRSLGPLPRPEEQCGVEVALHPAVEADRRPSSVEPDAPVEPDHVAPGLRHQVQEAGGTGAEVDRR